MAQILETALLNIVNFQILIATKSWRIQDLARLRCGVKRLVAPDTYPVFLTAGPWNKKECLLKRLLPRNKSGERRCATRGHGSGLTYV